MAAVPLAKLFIAPGSHPLKKSSLGHSDPSDGDEAENRVTEIFDKYNLLTLPVVDEDRKLVGVITADDIISVLRQK